MSAFDFMFKKKDDIAPPASKKPVMSSIIPPPVNMQTTISSTGGKTDYNKYLEDLMDKEDLPGPDYLEFSKGIIKSSNLPLTEEQKYQTVFGNFETMGLTIPKLVQTANQYLSILDREKAEFETQVEGERKIHVDGKQGLIQKEQDEIVELNRQIQEKSNNVTRMMTEKQDAQQSLLIEANNFNNAYTSKRDFITAQIGKIQTHLSNVTK